jgi:hypothetical protein
MESLQNKERYIPPPRFSGAVLGGAILIMCVILGSAYLSIRMRERGSGTGTLRVNNEPETVRAQTDVTMLQIYSSSDEIPLIRADLEATALDTFEGDLEALRREIAP